MILKTYHYIAIIIGEVLVCSLRLGCAIFHLIAGICSLYLVVFYISNREGVTTHEKQLIMRILRRSMSPFRQLTSKVVKARSAEVNQRIKAFSSLYPMGFIKTAIHEH